MVSKTVYMYGDSIHLIGAPVNNVDVANRWRYYYIY